MQIFSIVLNLGYIQRTWNPFLPLIYIIALILYSPLLVEKIFIQVWCSTILTFPFPGDNLWQFSLSLRRKTTAKCFLGSLVLPWWLTDIAMNWLYYSRDYQSGVVAQQICRQTGGMLVAYCFYMPRKKEGNRWSSDSNYFSNNIFPVVFLFAFDKRKICFINGGKT